MPSNRTVSVLAIAFGGILGAAAALVGRGSAPPPGARELPFEPVSWGPVQREPALADVRAEPPARRSPRAPSTTPRPAPAPDAELVSDRNAIKQAELACARGDGRACLAAGDAHLHGRGIAGDAERARMLTALGVQRFAIQCMDRVPKGCLELAKLHNTGHGVDRDEKAANALVDRATMLCRAKPDAPGCPGALE